jgi:4-hydroxybenzoate polyprenyltransferase
MEEVIVENDRKVTVISLIVLLFSIAISVVLYFVFHIVVIFLIFIPPVIYYILSQRDKNGSKRV